MQDAGKISAELAKSHALSEFEKYRIVQDRLYQSDFDRILLEDAAQSLQEANEPKIVNSSVHNPLQIEDGGEDE